MALWFSLGELTADTSGIGQIIQNSIYLRRRSSDAALIKAPWDLVRVRALLSQCHFQLRPKPEDH